MLPEDAIVRVAAEVESVTADLAERLRRGSVQSEDDFTVRLIDRIESRIDGLHSSNVEWRALKLTDRGRGAQEAEFGADVLGVLTVTKRGSTVSKGFLAQAKLLKADGVGRTGRRHAPIHTRRIRPALPQQRRTRSFSTAGRAHNGSPTRASVMAAVHLLRGAPQQLHR
jgi:hypothetical protein